MIATTTTMGSYWYGVWVIENTSDSTTTDYKTYVSPTSYTVTCEPNTYREFVEDIEFLIWRNQILEKTQEILLYWLTNPVDTVEKFIDRKTMLFRRMMRCNRKGVGLRIKDSR